MWKPSSDGGGLCDIIAKMLDCNLKDGEFEFQSHYYVLFQTNTLRKGMNPLISPVMG